ncbi:uncharacterized protein LOC124198435 [Daphnia pulex]|uniref:uncharacterized protein LOC124198435 n=1 Tax=Daphnia pulex TaxID=6669 RepID=UPI001EE12FB3|nr:uncharacterized protein LOC124198435 [Daphnia pulex]
MTFPSTIRFSTFVRIAFPAFLLSLIIIPFSLMTMNLMFTMYKDAKAFRHPSCAETKSNMNETLGRLVLERKNLQSKLNRLDSGYLNYLRQRNHNLAKKLFRCEVKKCQEKKIQQSRVKQDGKNVFDEKAFANVTVNREFFHYLANHLRNTDYAGVDNYTRYTVARLGLVPLVGVERLIPEFGPVINDVLSFKYPISIPPCQDQVITGGRTVFVAVISASDNFSIRKIIRQTWKNHLKEVHQEGLLGVAGFAFVLGLADNDVTKSRIKQEAKTYEDIIQIGIRDSYENLSLKTTGLFNWLYRYCAKVDFVLKVDDDVYVNVRNLVHFVQTFHPSNQSIFGLLSPHPYFWPERGKIL